MSGETKTMKSINVQHQHFRGKSLIDNNTNDTHFNSLNLIPRFSTSILRLLCALCTLTVPFHSHKISLAISADVYAQCTCI